MNLGLIVKLSGLPDFAQVTIIMRSPFLIVLLRYLRHTHPNVFQMCLYFGIPIPIRNQEVEVYASWNMISTTLNHSSF